MRHCSASSSSRRMQAVHWCRSVWCYPASLRILRLNFSRSLEGPSPSGKGAKIVGGRLRGCLGGCAPGKILNGAGRRRSLGMAARNGLSLLEVIISVAIFLGAMTAIMQGLSVGQRSELAARLQSEAVLRCEAKMGEIICGAVKATSSEGNNFEDDETGNWKWSSQVTDGGAPGLLQITVVVEHKPGGDEPNAGFTLIRMMRDPQLFLDAALQGSGK